MPPTAPPSITDIVGLAVFVAAMIFSDEAAAVIGPYMVIVAAAMIGASFSVARRGKTSRLGAVVYFARVAGLAVLITGGLAAALAAYRPDLQPRVTIAPIALVIGFADWPKVLAKVVQMAFAFMDLVRGKGGTS